MGAAVILDRPTKKRVRHANRRGHALRQLGRAGVYTQQMNSDAGSGGPVIDQLETSGSNDPLFHSKAQMRANDVAAITSNVDVQPNVGC